MRLSFKESRTRNAGWGSAVGNPGSLNPFFGFKGGIRNGMHLVFHRDANDRISGLSVFQGRIRNVTFPKDQLRVNHQESERGCSTVVAGGATALRPANIEVFD